MGAIGRQKTMTPTAMHQERSNLWLLDRLAMYVD